MNLFKKIVSALRDPERSHDERILILLALMGNIVLIITWIFDFIIKENGVEGATLLVMIVLVNFVTNYSIKKQKVHMGIMLQVSATAFIIVPVTFFFGGGMQGGGVFWAIFSFLFIGVSLHGRTRIIMLLIQTAELIAMFIVAYLFPGIGSEHSRGDQFVDAFVSLLLVGLMAYIMVWYQNYLFKQENDRAVEQTKRAEELNRAQNRFFSSMSHEIRTPINTVLGLNEIIMRQEDASDEIKRDARNIQGAGKMLLALVNDILDVSKIEAGKMEIVPVTYKVSVILSEIVNMIWLKAEEKGLRLSVDVDPSTPSELYGDEVRIKQILINILNNAVKYTSEGEVKLHIESEDIGEDQVVLTLSVSDTGMGIKQESLPHLFDAFQRVDEEKNRMIEGTGLGLSIVKQLVELMDGKISVNSVYKQGSTFTVSIKQQVSNSSKVGDINIMNHDGGYGSGNYESEFTAETARILIVDDNEMNLEVEKKLLTETRMIIDTVTSGEDALEMTLIHVYDVIFMDHLMPEMDGIECMNRVRSQTGGLNKNCPIIVLTANAGGENKKLYDMSGFDGYLIKPVSGMQLEEMLIKFLPKEKVDLNLERGLSHKELSTKKGYSRKTPVIITTSSMCDLPESIRRSMNLDIIPFLVRTDGGEFWDLIETGADELIRYIDAGGRTLKSTPPTEEEFEDFFAQKLKKAHKIIHITIASGMSEEYNIASSAANAFENVMVVNSEAISSATGLLVLVAYKMARQNVPAEKIVEELEVIKKRIHCGFVLRETLYMKNRGFISSRVHNFMTTMAIRPSLVVKNDKLRVERFWVGRRRKRYADYIKHVLPKSAKPDLDVVFITYVAIKEDDLKWIEDEVKARFDFKNIVFQKASAAISLNCGPGSFGILYMDKGDADYGLGSLIVDEKPEPKRIVNHPEDEPKKEDENNKIETRDNITGKVIADYEPETNTTKWYETIEGIDGASAIKNSGSEEALRSVLKIFYDSIDSKAQELGDYFFGKGWNDYTIKVHALKSSARLIGATKLSEDALALEMAGKEENVEFILANHYNLINEFKAYKDKLGKLFAEETGHEQKSDKPVADMSVIESVYDELREAAGEMDCDRIDAVFDEMKNYAIPQEEKERFFKLKERSEQFDYDGILSLLKTDN